PTDRAAYGRLSRLLTLGKRRADKGACLIVRGDFLNFAEGQIVLALAPQGGTPFDGDAFLSHLRVLKDALGRDDLFLAASMLYRGAAEPATALPDAIPRGARTPRVATNDGHMPAPKRRPLQDVLTCTREKCTIAAAGYRLAANAERHLKPPAEMARLFRRHP